MSSSAAHPEQGEEESGNDTDVSIDTFCELLYEKIMADIQKYGLQTLLKKAKLQD